MKTSARRVWERVAIVSGLIGGAFLVASFTLLLTPAPVIATAVTLPIGFAGLVFGILLALWLRRGVAADSWPRSGRRVPR
ncbi:hypothetical protein [Frondihabitans australicus]|uniref:Uncharacterized protein n=1 Tax=Frondihabitans australicus TaxID=386892 RepID=A0A495II93_9MICO|nr:hypothetical protein [Frondihabitans australicus]RKR75420.1 hypothetical protein C8E83_2568 [Frondihabitans australicus]